MLECKSNARFFQGSCKKMCSPQLAVSRCLPSASAAAPRKTLADLLLSFASLKGGQPKGTGGDITCAVQHTGQCGGSGGA